jgi:uncharacterized Zn-binding protein involved in type VI secretion
MPVTVKVNGAANSLVHKGSNGISMATIPDVCKTPTPGGPVPMPYPNISQSTTLDKGTTTVKADGMMIAIKGSEFSLSNGDNAGVAGGVKSSTFMKESTWILYSFDVKMDGQNACRLTDKKFQNHENTADLTGVVQTVVKVPEPTTLDCGDLGAYGDQLDITGDGSLNRDHVPSKKALLNKAREMIFPKALSAAQESAIINSALTICVPTPLHQSTSPTYGGRQNQIMDDGLRRHESDAGNLQDAAKRDTKAMQDKLKETDPECAKKYAAAAKKVNAITDQQYEDWIDGILAKVE